MFRRRRLRDGIGVRGQECRPRPERRIAGGVVHHDVDVGHEVQVRELEGALQRDVQGHEARIAEAAARLAQGILGAGFSLEFIVGGRGDGYAAG